NLSLRLEELGYKNLIRIDRDSTEQDLEQGLQDADFIYHLAGVNRPKTDDEFKSGNSDLTKYIVEYLISIGKKIPIMLSSSIQAELDNAYGVSKALAERYIEKYATTSGSPYYIFRYPNVFGKWCKPNYNSFVATFCYNIANDLAITIN
ncbi:NAD-dependent epimerase/dehydratase family protein, partial [Escherichia coli]|nr:NAD-dependent epimerase/dehydratase family protein [Escherichia coli]